MATTMSPPVQVDAASLAEQETMGSARASINSAYSGATLSPTMESRASSSS